MPDRRSTWKHSMPSLGLGLVLLLIKLPYMPAVEATHVSHTISTGLCSQCSVYINVCVNVCSVTDWFLRCTTQNRNVTWESRSAHFASPLDTECDITPYIIVGRMVLECCYGPERHSKQKNKILVSFCIFGTNTAVFDITAIHTLVAMSLPGFLAVCLCCM